MRPTNDRGQPFAPGPSASSGRLLPSGWKGEKFNPPKLYYLAVGDSPNPTQPRGHESTSFDELTVSPP
jgi:hypothetical protein